MIEINLESSLPCFYLAKCRERFLVLVLGSVPFLFPFLSYCLIYDMMLMACVAGVCVFTICLILFLFSAPYLAASSTASFPTVPIPMCFNSGYCTIFGLPCNVFYCSRSFFCAMLDL